MKQATLILVRGLPGSGKSYLAHALGESLGQDHVVMLDPDSVDQDSPEYAEHVQSQVEEGVDPALHLYRFSRKKAWQGIEDGKIIIWNQPFTNREVFDKMTSGLLAYAAEHDVSLKILVVDVQIDPEVARARVEQRKNQGGHGPSHDRFDRFVQEFTSFADGYDTISVQGDAAVNESVQTILEAIKNA